MWFKNKNLNYKTNTCPGNVQSQPFLPTQFPLPHRINALLASQMPKLSTLAYQNKTLWSNSSLCYTTHLCQPILSQSPKGTPLNFTSLGLRLSSRTSIFWTLPKQLSMLHHAFVPTHPEPTSQRYITKAQTLRFSSHTSALNFAGTALHVTPRMWANPSWTNVMTHYKLQIRTCSSHTSLFWTLPEQLSVLHPACVPTHPEPTSQRYITKPQTLRFSSHTSALNFAGTALHVTPRMWANPSWTNVMTHYKLQIRTCSSHTSLFWTLPEQLSILHHACVPTHPEPTFQRHTAKPQIDGDCWWLMVIGGH